MTEIPKPESMRANGGMWLECGNSQLHLGVEVTLPPKSGSLIEAINHDKEISTVSKTKGAVQAGIQA